MRSFDDLATSQHGVVTTRQLVELGWSERAIGHAVRAERIERLRTGAYRLAGTKRCWEQAAIAAVLVSGDGARLSHDSAARLAGFDAWPQHDGIDVLLVGPNAPRGDGIRGHTSQSLPADHVTTRNLIPSTTPERTFVDACGSVGPIHLERTGDDLLRRRVMSLPRLVRAYEHVPVSGRRKRRPVGAYLADRIEGFDPCESPAELDVIRVLRRHGRPLPVTQHRVVACGHRYRIDFAYPDLLEAMEWQGEAHHGQVSAMFGDSLRTTHLQRAGWRVWPLTRRTTLGELLGIVDDIHRDHRDHLDHRHRDAIAS